MRALVSASLTLLIAVLFVALAVTGMCVHPMCCEDCETAGVPSSGPLAIVRAMLARLLGSTARPTALLAVVMTAAENAARHPLPTLCAPALLRI